MSAINLLSHVDRATGESVRRYEHDHPGVMLHVDVKKLGELECLVFFGRWVEVIVRWGWVVSVPGCNPRRPPGGRIPAGPVHRSVVSRSFTRVGGLDARGPDARGSWPAAGFSRPSGGPVAAVAVPSLSRSPRS